MQSRVFGLLLQNEVLAADLYAHFVHRYPAGSAFWHALAEEEVKHGDLLKAISAHAPPDKLILDVSIVDLASLQATTEQLTALAQRIRSRPIPERAALSHAISIETIVEKCIPAPAATHSPTFNVIAGTLVAHSRKHHLMAQERLESLMPAGALATLGMLK